MAAPSWPCPWDTGIKASTTELASPKKRESPADDERMQLVYDIKLLQKIWRNHLHSEHLQWNDASFNVKINCQNTLYAATHRMSFPSLKKSRIYLMHDHGILRDIFFGSRHFRAKQECSCSGNTLACLEIRSRNEEAINSTRNRIY